MFISLLKEIEKKNVKEERRKERKKKKDIFFE